MSLARPETDRTAAGEMIRRAREALHVPPEGEGGFSQSWYPICLSAEIDGGKIHGTDFLDGRVIAFRNTKGEAQVLSAYCPHVGADLSVGTHMGDTVRCAFHHWEFDSDGTCTKTGIGDPPPAAACLFKFPTAEKFGIIWAFNGEDPWWDLPDFPYPEEELVMRPVRLGVVLPVDPWVFAANTPDMQHIKVVHRIGFDLKDLDERVRWTDHSMEYDFEGHLEHGDGPPVSYTVGIYGTTLFIQHGTIDGRWWGGLAPFALLRPGRTEVFGFLATTKGDGTPASDQAINMFMDQVMAMESQIVQEDVPILSTIRYRGGTMTAADTTLRKFLHYVKNYPRAHPSADFIR